MKAADISSEHPIDEFSVRATEQWLADVPHVIVYPAESSIGLQALGKLAGWHHESPFRVGVNAAWGSWYAYRVAALTDSNFAPTAVQVSTAPCATCQPKSCVMACPADALRGEGFDLQKCIAYRKSPTSRCQATCVARLACPVGSEHRYSDEQLAHTYTNSLRMIERHRR